MLLFTVEILKANITKTTIVISATNEEEMYRMVKFKYPKSAVLSYGSYDPSVKAPSHI